MTRSSGHPGSGEGSQIRGRYSDGTPEYRPAVTDGYRRLKVRAAVYAAPPPRGAGIRLGVYQVQADCGPGAKEKNLARMDKAIATAKNFGVQLLAFPELFVPGYALGPEEARTAAELQDGPSLARAREAAGRNGMALVLPYAEKAQSPGGGFRYYDSVAVIDENGELLDSYRKTHLYGQQERDNWSPGNSEFPVHAVFGFPFGVLNCYECEFPEPARILALRGAKLIVGPTAADRYYRLPDGRRSTVPYPDIARLLLPAQAYFNNLFFAYANRCGYERRGEDEWHYRGNSIVCGPHGDVVVAAESEQDTLLVADCVPSRYGMTHPAPKYYYLRDRRPELYGRLVSNSARFLEIDPDAVDLETDFLAGGFVYPAGEERTD
ncbi:MAG TPA: carbon-nitrogen hydrolase family protein [bacterium]|nr:carbon-nitrogen hydrolase family protein [bacterium]